MSKVNKTGHVNGQVSPQTSALRILYVVLEVLLVEREGFRVLSSARDLYVYKNCPFLTLARA